MLVSSKKLVSLIPWAVLSVVFAAPPYEWNLLTRALGFGLAGGLWMTYLFPEELTDDPPNRKLD